MICFALEVNGRRLALAGLPGFAVLNANLTWVQRKPQHAKNLASKELQLHLGGLDSNGDVGGTHVNWVDQELAVGDRVVFEVVESDVSDPPKKRSTAFKSRELKKDRVRSARHYLKEYEREREILSKWIRECRKTIAAEKQTKKKVKHG